jgi:hypothetical protein
MVDPEHQVDIWEIILYTMTLSFFVEEAVKVYKTIRITPRPLATIGFWTIVAFMTDILLLSAFILRVIGLSMNANHDDRAQDLHFKSFQVLSCVAPLIWLKLVSVFFILMVAYGI